MYKVVKCPKCGLELKTRGQKYFMCYHCQMAFLINKCEITGFEDKRYVKKRIHVGRVVGTV